MNPAIVKTSQGFVLTVTAFVLAGYSSVLLGACSEVRGYGDLGGDRVF
jgi:hypothetical protein